MTALHFRAASHYPGILQLLTGVPLEVTFPTRILSAVSRRVLSGIVLSRSAHGDEVQRFRSLSELREVVIWGTFAVLERIWRRVTFAVLQPECVRKCFRRVIPISQFYAQNPVTFAYYPAGVGT